MIRGGMIFFFRITAYFPFRRLAGVSIKIESGFLLMIFHLFEVAIQSLTVALHTLL